MNSQNKIWWSRGIVIVPILVIFVIISGLLLAFLPGHLLVSWLGDKSSGTERNKALGAAAQVVLFSLGGLIALVGVGLSLSRHGEEVQAADRDRSRDALEKAKEDRRASEVHNERMDALERSLRDRFVTAVGLLSDSKQSIKRLAGVYAICAVADDWSSIERSDERQHCIDMICGYLRSPTPGGSVENAEEDKIVRETAFQLIGMHLNENSNKIIPWEGAYFDLQEVEIKFRVKWDGLVIRNKTNINLQGANVSDGGDLRLQRTSVEADGIINLSSAKVTARATVNLQDATISNGGRILATGLEISDGGKFRSQDMTISHGGFVTFYRGCARSKGALEFSGVSIADQGILTFTKFSVRGASKFSISRVKVSIGSRLFFKKVHVLESSKFILTKLDITIASSVNFLVYSDTSSFVNNFCISRDDTSEINQELGESPKRLIANYINLDKLERPENSIAFKDVCKISSIRPNELDSYQSSGWLPNKDTIWAWEDVMRSEILAMAARNHLGDSNLQRMVGYLKSPREKGHNLLVVGTESCTWVPRALGDQFMNELDDDVLLVFHLRDHEALMRKKQKSL